MKTVLQQRNNIKIEIVDFGVKDRRGRVVGARVVTAVHVYTPASPTETGWTYCTAPGTYWYASVQVTRNGKTYGALQPEKLFPTADARDAWVQARLKASKMRATHLTGEQTMTTNTYLVILRLPEAVGNFPDDTYYATVDATNPGDAIQHATKMAADDFADTVAGPGYPEFAEDCALIMAFRLGFGAVELVAS